MDHTTVKIISVEDAAAFESILMSYPAVPLGTLKKVKIVCTFDELPNIAPGEE